MKHLRYGISFVLCILVTSTSIAQKANISTTQNSIAAEKARWEKHVAQTTIIRDEWGIPHIYGKTDADAVFGLTILVLLSYKRSTVRPVELEVFDGPYCVNPYIGLFTVEESDMFQR